MVWDESQHNCGTAVSLRNFLGDRQHYYVGFLSGLRRQVHFLPRDRRLLVFLRDDVVALKDASRLVAADAHCDSLRRTAPIQCSNRTTSQIMYKKSQPGGTASCCPNLPNVTYRFPATVENERTV